VLGIFSFVILGMFGLSQDVHAESLTFATDNVKIQPHQIDPRSSPDLIIDSITHSPANPYTDDMMEFTAVVKNVGAVVSEPSTLEFRIGGETPGPDNRFSVPALNPGDTHIEVRELNLSVALNYQNTAIADIFDDVAESDENNNTGLDNYSVEQSTLQPDLIIDSITHSPANPYTDDMMEFTAVVKNIGTSKSAFSSLEFRIGGETPGPDNRFSVPALDPGETYIKIREMNMGVAQNYQNTAIADIFNENNESHEDNNESKDSYSVIESKFPDWIKNTFKWYVDGVISEQELVGALQFLINEGILKVD
jgi:subtilase family serine protease